MIPLKTKEETLELMYSKWVPQPAAEKVSIYECLGRVLAEDVYAEYNIPGSKIVSHGRHSSKVISIF